MQFPRFLDGDCTPSRKRLRSFLHHPALRRVEQRRKTDAAPLALEKEPGEEELAIKKAHTHLSEIAHAIDVLGDRVQCKHIVLEHFSMKYTRDRVFELIAAGVPAHVRDRVHVLLYSHGEITVTESQRREADSGPTLRSSPRPGDVRGRRHSLELATGYLVGFDAGEWGGSLTWYRRDGSGAQELGRENVHGLAVLGPDLAISLEGLAHLSINRGAVRWIERSGTTVNAAKPTALPDAPRTFARANSGEVYVVTRSSFVKVTPDRRVEVVQPVNTKRLYPDSMTIDADGSLWVGMRRFVLRLTPSGDKYTETWFVKQGCQEMSQRNLDCSCR